MRRKLLETGSSAAAALPWRHSSAADSVNIPQFLRINFKQKSITAVDESGKKASIRTLEHIDGKMIMQGIQEGRGWTMIISEQTGKMSATVTDDQVGFVIFGACTPLK